MNQEVVKRTILAVDDAPANIDIVKGVLSQDYLVQAAINGEMALKIAQKKQPDLILLDIQMPEMDGFEVCRRLKSDPTTAAIPVLFVTGQSDVMNEAKGLMLGAVDFILKPIEPKLLLSRVRVHLTLAEEWQAKEEAYLARIESLEMQIQKIKNS
uniref:Putative response regulator receiver protein n=1 Tax=Magnetococcus massalia (strain MO-1) TaxID=451514 RepID=A0A1S7LI00_MAGMO|nr:Putative response regulator receiver protein [Candidatus Magnetococcus massalia]